MLMYLVLNILNNYNINSFGYTICVHFLCYLADTVMQSDLHKSLLNPRAKNTDSVLSVIAWATLQNPNKQ